jgi:hypothetical protein
VGVSGIVEWLWIREEDNGEEEKKGCVEVKNLGVVKNLHLVRGQQLIKSGLGFELSIWHRLLFSWLTAWPVLG